MILPVRPRLRLWRSWQDRHAVVGIEFEEIRRELIAPPDVARDDLVVQTCLFEENRNFLAVRCRPVMKMQRHMSPDCKVAGRSAARARPAAADNAMLACYRWNDKHAAWIRREACPGRLPAPWRARRRRELARSWKPGRPGTGMSVLDQRTAGV